MIVLGADDAADQLLIVEELERLLAFIVLMQRQRLRVGHGFSELEIAVVVEDRVERNRSAGGGLQMREMLEARERAQWSADEKRRRADLVITNDAGVESLQREVERVEAALADLSCPVIETAN